MATKDLQLRRHLIKTAIVMVVIAAALMGGAFALSTYDDSEQNAKANAQAKNDAIHAEHEQVNAALSKQLEMTNLYDVYSKNHNTNLLIDRNTGPQYLKDLREENHLNKVDLDISAVSDVAGPEFTLKSGIMIKYEVKLGIFALSDASVYNFMEGLQRKMPGIIYIHHIKLSRKSEISKDELEENINEHKIEPALEGELSYFWLGIRTKPVEDPTASPANRRFRGMPGNG